VFGIGTGGIARPVGPVVREGLDHRRCRRSARLLRGEHGRFRDAAADDAACGHRQCAREERHLPPHAPFGHRGLYSSFNPQGLQAARFSRGGLPGLAERKKIRGKASEAAVASTKKS